MKVAAALIFALAASPAFGSYLEACELETTVEEVVAAPALDDTVTEYTILAKLRIDSAVDRGSHISTVCEEKIGEAKWLTVKPALGVAAGDQLKIDYFYANSLSPTGVMQSERWTIIQ